MVNGEENATLEKFLKLLGLIRLHIGHKLEIDPIEGVVAFVKKVFVKRTVQSVKFACALLLKKLL